MTVVQLVDNIEYVRTNCYQHQLLKTLQDNVPELITLPVASLTPVIVSSASTIISCLKLRTLDRLAPTLATILKDRAIRVYDQDPWEAFKDDSPHKGAYARISSTLNVERYAVAVKWWAEHAKNKGFPAEFVRIWIIPEYCDKPTQFENRHDPIAFVGGMWPYRKQFFDHVESMGVTVKFDGGMNYDSFRKRLRDVQVFLHSADMEFTIDGEPCNMKKALWAKEVDACSQGCYCIREQDPDSNSFFTADEVKTTRFFKHRSEIPDLINSIQAMDPAQRQLEIDQTVEFFRTTNRWVETVQTLIK